MKGRVGWLDGWKDYRSPCGGVCSIRLFLLFFPLKSSFDPIHSSMSSPITKVSSRGGRGG